MPTVTARPMSVYTMRLPMDLKSRLIQLARAAQLPESTFVRRILREYVEKDQCRY